MTVTAAPPRRPVPAADQPVARPRRRVWTMVLVGLLALLLAGGLWVVGFSSVLATTTVVVSGVDVLSKAEVREAARVPLGRPLARQDLDRVARGVAELRPVRSVSVDRRWPHTIVIRVVERTPTIAVRQPDGLLLLDRFGVGYQTVTKVPDGVVRAEIDPSYSALAVDVAEVVTALPAKLKADVEVIEARSPPAIVLVLDSGVRVVWGTAAESELKATITRALLERKPKQIDVSAPHNPAVR